MAIVRSEDGRFFDVEDSELEKHEIKTEDLPAGSVYARPQGGPGGQGGPSMGGMGGGPGMGTARRRWRRADAARDQPRRPRRNVGLAADGLGPAGFRSGSAGSGRPAGWRSRRRAGAQLVRHAVAVAQLAQLA